MKKENLFFALAFIAMCVLGYLSYKAETEQLDNTYYMQIVDEHEVRLISSHDTIVLYFENAYALEEQSKTVIIEK